MGSKDESLKVVLLPFLAHGHVSSFLELAKRLSQYMNFQVYLCSTPINLSSVKNKISESESTRIQLIELCLPSLPDLPPHRHTTNGLPVHLHHLLYKVLRMGKSDFTDFLQKLQPDLLVHDLVVPWAAAVAARQNVPAVTFSSMGTAALSYFSHLASPPEIQFPFPALSLTQFELSVALADMNSGMIDPEDPDDQIHVGNNNNNTIILVKTSREMEGKYVDYLTEFKGWTVVPIGTLVPEPSSASGGGDTSTTSGLMEWLGGKDEFSTVFVSFGSQYFLKKEEIEELAHGLEMSGVNFIWVIRIPEGEDKRVEEVLPEGFVARVGERGMILEKWAPQVEILSHSSVGGFVSHCGWGSTTESIDSGVPIVCMPMHQDQPLNAKLLVELGVGVEVKRDGEGKFTRQEISTAIKAVVVEPTGKDLRGNMGKLRERVRSASRKEIDGFVEMVIKICSKNNQ